MHIRNRAKGTVFFAAPSLTPSTRTSIARAVTIIARPGFAAQAAAMAAPLCLAAITVPMLIALFAPQPGA